MSSRTLSSKVKIKTSELPPEALRRYGFFDEQPELDLSRTTDARRQDQHLKDGIRNTLYRLELDSVKPGFDVLAQTGFRKGYHLRKRNPDEELVYLDAAATPHINKVKRQVRPHSYIEPRFLHHQSTQPFGKSVNLREASYDPPVRIKEVIHREPVPRSRASSVWYYTEPHDYSFLRSTYPSHLRSIAEPEGGRILSEYKDTLVPVSPKRHNRWSVHGSTSLSRSQSTPPESFGSSLVRHPIVGDRLTRTKNREYSIGVKLAESQTDLDTFNRLLDKKFGGGDNLPSSSHYSFYPSHPSVYYNYLVPRTQYEYNVYSPRTRVTKPSERTVTYGYTDSAPYSSSYYSRYTPSSYNYADHYSTQGFRNEPWYMPYYRSSYYSGSHLRPSVGSYATRYLY